MKILVKSDSDIFEKEKNGVKNSTIRKLDGRDVIEITNKATQEKIERKITDITLWDGQLVISFKGEEK